MPQGATALATRPQPAQTGPGMPVAPLHGPWANPSIFGHRWPGPALPPAPAAISALLIAGVMAALSIPLDRAGIGWLITAIAGVAALTAARMAPHRISPTAPKPLVTRTRNTLTRARFGWSAATVALLGVGTFRSAGWLFVLCLLTAILTGALAVAGGRSLRSMSVATIMTPLAGFRALNWIRRGLATAGRAGGSGLRITATVAVSLVLLLVFGSLFASADAAFADLIEAAVPDISAITIVRWIFVFLLTTFILGGAAFLRAAPPNLDGLDSPGKRRVARLEWAVPLTLLVLLFAMFVAVQLTVLFGDSKHVLDTDGLTYAEYARSGFWQLLVVTGLTLVVLAGAARWAPRGTSTDRLLIRGILGLLAALTLVIVASAIHRMDLYADTYGLTRLRVLVAVCELWLGLTFVLILIAGIRLKAAWLPRAVVALGVLSLLSLAVANPDHLIADRNITRFEQTGRIDRSYLSDLSPDAVPALTRLKGDDRTCTLIPIARDLADNTDDWRAWNLGRHQAREALKANPPYPTRPCLDLYR
ncbi:DUF4153 domain-containing protein [Actinoplanes friuliensis]|uniref:Uncharacterized protein n=1 Tax=Actinoplanes friuliensis DSM 7358 TaxID=1246995 RepID=U5WC64_9ACTN|nr:DUF4173 domain-containing protein [Actinoplanes friuliensis]AGZ46744.1 hypothetical protein AFR_42450 [Actinoplanes friuliensis DSM 7358]